MDFVTTDIRFLFKAQYFLQYFRFTNNKNTWKTKINWVAENKSGYRIGKWICKYATWFLNRVTFLRIRFSSCTIYMAYSIFMLRFCVFRNSCCVFTNSWSWCPLEIPILEPDFHSQPLNCIAVTKPLRSCSHTRKSQEPLSLYLNACKTRNF